MEEKDYKDSDFRIGNWVKVFLADSKLSKMRHKPVQLNEYAFRNLQDEIDNGHILPVELTEEIMNNVKSVKLQWLEISYRGKYAQFTIQNILMYFMTDKNTIEIHGCERTIKYLHNFQNLFYALTGNDLELNKIPE